MIRKLLIGVVLLGLLAVVDVAQKQLGDGPLEKIKPATPFSISGITFRSPDEDGWVVVESVETSLILWKGGKDRSFYARAGLITLNEPSADFIKRILEQKKLPPTDTESEYLTVSNFQFGKLSGIRFEGQIPPIKGIGKIFIDRAGRFYAHPKLSKTLIYVEYFAESLNGGFSGNESLVGEKFLNSIDLTKLN